MAMTFGCLDLRSRLEISEMARFGGEFFQWSTFRVVFDLERNEDVFFSIEKNGIHLKSESNTSTFLVTVRSYPEPKF